VKNLWTPWRMAYIEGKEGKKGGCIFCAAQDKPFSKDDLILYRDPILTVLMNRFPYSNGHLLVAPSRHLAEITELNHEENSRLAAMLQQCTVILKKHLRPDGFNIGLNLGKVAGAGIADHLHYHIVPRWEGDHNFMTVLDEVRTIPEHIDNTFARLQPEFKEALIV